MPGIDMFINMAGGFLLDLDCLDIFFLDLLAALKSILDLHLMLDSG
jgi:hypothetical protein